jgi:UDP-glucose 4-epimerase
MNILVTGGAGFIGSHLCDVLVEQGHNVTVVDNLSLGRIDNLDQLTIEPNFTFYKQDLTEIVYLRILFERHKFDMVYHLAANSDIKKGSKNSYVDFDNTFLTTYNVLTCMAEFHVNKLFFASTSAIFGETVGLISETYSPLEPISNYGAAKLASEAFISSFSATHNIQTWIARFPNVVGERATHGVVYDFIKRLKEDPTRLKVLGDGNQTKPYIYVKDLIEGIQFIINNSNERYNVYHLGSDTFTNVKTIASVVILEMKLDPVIEYTGGSIGWVGDVSKFAYDLTKINRLGWSPKHSSTQAIYLSVNKILEQYNG